MTPAGRPPPDRAAFYSSRGEVNLGAKLVPKAGGAPRTNRTRVSCGSLARLLGWVLLVPLSVLRVGIRNQQVDADEFSRAGSAPILRP